jgi:hypothetical protein
MIDFDKKNKTFYNRANHQLREIELSCKEVVSMSKQLNLFAN